MNKQPMRSETARQTWLKSMLLKHGRPIFERCAYFYAQLCALPRAARRRLKATAGAGLTTLALALALSGAPTVQAATITVDGDGSGGTCSLADAITAANSNTATGNCIAGDDAGGYDTIDLQVASSTIVDGNISSDIVINGNGNTMTAGGGGRVLNVNNGASLTINEATVTGGDAGVGPGGGIFNAGTLVLNSSTISGNSAGSGGGIYNTESSLTLNNSTVSGNTAANGGGIFNYASAYGPTGADATATLNNSTVTGNSASNNGGGFHVYAYYYVDSVVDLNRSIVSGNSAAGGPELYLYGSYANLYADNYNVIGVDNNAGIANNGTVVSYGGGGDVIPGAGVMIGDILDTTLANNGTQPHADTHALVAGSPAIDIIPTTDGACNPGSTVDQRGAARANGANQGGTDCDAGAFEYASTETPLAVIMGRSGTEAGGSSGGLVAMLSALLLAAGTAWATLWRKREQWE